MGYSKLIPIGSAGQLSIAEAGGVAQLQLSLSESVGGGSVAGVAKGSVSASIEVSALELVDAGLGLLESKFPAVASIIAVLKAAIDAEASKV